MIPGLAFRAATARAALFLFAFLLIGCDDRPGEWSAIVYPDKGDRTNFRMTPRFSMLSYCLSQAKEQMKSIQVSSGGDYECGRDCDQSGDPHKANMCKEIHK